MGDPDYPPLTGGISASSSPGEIIASVVAYTPLMAMAMLLSLLRSGYNEISCCINSPAVICDAMVRETIWLPVISFTIPKARIFISRVTERMLFGFKDRQNSDQLPLKGPRNYKQKGERVS